MFFIFLTFLKQDFPVGLEIDSDPLMFDIKFFNSKRKKLQLITSYQVKLLLYLIQDLHISYLQK